MPGTSKKISELDSASSLDNNDLLEVAVVNALSETGYSSKKTTIEDIADKVVDINPQAQADWTEADNSDPSYIQNKPTLATVATSGDYDDLTNKPTIPAAQVNSDWNSVSGVSEILNKPTLGTAASKNTGVANGVAELDSNGLVPTSQLPAYVDDVLEYASRSAFPATGETGKIYVALDTNLTYRWGGSEYVEISPSLALGETSSTAYAGNKGKANADAIAALQTAVGGLATVATTGDYDDLIDKPTIPTVNNATVTFTQGGTTKGSITLNQSADATIALDAGGGGSGGHTILDDEGTSLTQRNDLQFKGAYSVDNSTDQITEVNVVREMTALEFEQLTDDEKVGIINVTDATSSGDNEFQPIIYSEEEREIGVWIDGKPLYEKTLVTNTPTALTNNAWAVIPWENEPTNIETLVNTQMTGVCPNVWYTVRFSLENGHICGASVSNANFPESNVDTYVVIQYTKSTDQAGSGTWTPQGVPAVHYSTTEQVVGTWIDGSTIYEQTFQKTVACDTNVVVIDQTDIPNLATIISAEGNLGVMPLNFYNTSNYKTFTHFMNNVVNCYVKSSSDNSVSSTITLRYTKSST